METLKIKLYQNDSLCTQMAAVVDFFEIYENCYFDIFTFVPDMVRIVLYFYQYDIKIRYQLFTD